VGTAGPRVWTNKIPHRKRSSICLQVPAVVAEVVPVETPVEVAVVVGVVITTATAASR
jgi:hypothetical protein